MHGSTWQIFFTPIFLHHAEKEIISSTGLSSCLRVASTNYMAVCLQLPPAVKCLVTKKTVSTLIIITTGIICKWVIFLKIFQECNNKEQVLFDKNLR